MIERIYISAVETIRHARAYCRATMPLETQADVLAYLFTMRAFEVAEQQATRRDREWGQDGAWDA